MRPAESAEERRRSDDMLELFGKFEGFLFYLRGRAGLDIWHPCFITYSCKQVAVHHCDDELRMPCESHRNYWWPVWTDCGRVAELKKLALAGDFNKVEDAFEEMAKTAHAILPKLRKSLVQYIGDISSTGF